jgi:hypothetical protein
MTSAPVREMCMAFAALDTLREGYEVPVEGAIAPPWQSRLAA